VEAFDRVIDRLDPPMWVVTTAVGDERAGCLVGFATQTSIDPARFLVCLSERNRTLRLAAEARAVAVHLLGADGRGLAELFGANTGDEVDKFARCAWRPGPAGTPVLDAVQAWFGGWVLERIPLGDHVGFLLEPFAGDAGPVAPPLGFQQVRDLDPGHEA
jgi:flavin reductase (DIM6/NTAB) family NADH-FMN oxidoreductase RutF